MTRLFIYFLLACTFVFATNDNYASSIVQRLKERFALANDPSSNPELIARLNLDTSFSKKLKEKLAIPEDQLIVQGLKEKLGLSKDETSSKLIFEYLNRPINPPATKSFWHNFGRLFGIGNQSNWTDKFYDMLGADSQKMNRIKDDLKDAKEKAGEAISDIQDASATAKDVAKEKIIDTATTATKAAKGVAENVKNEAKEKLSTAAENLKATATGAAKTVKTAAGIAKETMEVAKETAQESADIAKETVTGAAEYVKGAAGTAKDKVSEAAGGAAEYMKEKAENLKYSATGAAEDMKEFVQAAKGALKTKAHQAKDTAAEGLENLKEGVQGAKESVGKMADKTYQNFKDTDVKGKWEAVKENAKETGEEYKEHLKAKAGLDPKEHTFPQLKEQFEKKIGLDTELPIRSQMEGKLDEAQEKAKETILGVGHEVKEKLKQKADTAKEALQDVGYKIRDWAESTSKDSDLTEEERLTLKQLILRMGRSPSEIVSNNDFMTFYDENTPHYQQLTGPERALVVKVVKKYLSSKEKDYVQQFKENIGLQEKPLGTKLKDNIKETIENVKQNFKDSIGLGDDKYKRKVEL